MESSCTTFTFGCLRGCLLRGGPFLRCRSHCLRCLLCGGSCLRCLTGWPSPRPWSLVQELELYSALVSKFQIGRERPVVFRDEVLDELCLALLEQVADHVTVNGLAGVDFLHLKTAVSYSTPVMLRSLYHRTLTHRATTQWLLIDDRFGSCRTATRPLSKLPFQLVVGLEQEARTELEPAPAHESVEHLRPLLGHKLQGLFATDGASKNHLRNAELT